VTNGVLTDLGDVTVNVPADQNFVTINASATLAGDVDTSTDFNDYGVYISENDTSCNNIIEAPGAYGALEYGTPISFSDQDTTSYNIVAGVAPSTPVTFSVCAITSYDVQVGLGRITATTAPFEGSATAPVHRLHARTYSKHAATPSMPLRH
jgi:hypothetical protein